MQLPKGFEAFPSGYDEVEGQVAGLCACVDFTGKSDAAGTFIAAWGELFSEETKKNPTVPPEIIAANILTFIKKDMSIERVNLVGPPLRITWFLLEYHAWVLVAARCGWVRLGDDAVSESRTEVLAAMAELGVRCSPAECEAEIERWVPQKRILSGNNPLTAREISFASGIFVQFIRYLHCAALRHRSYVTLGFVEAGILVVADEHDGEVAEEITRYLIMHGLHAYDGIARCQETDRVLALLSEASIVAHGFWAKVAAARRHGLRPIAMTLCDRIELDHLEALVSDAFRGDFEWLKATAVVEFRRDNRVGAISILRALEPTTKWWWRDDAIMAVIGTSLGSAFDATASRRESYRRVRDMTHESPGRGSRTWRLLRRLWAGRYKGSPVSPMRKPMTYPALGQYQDIQEAFRLAQVGADDFVAQQNRTSSGEWTAEKSYRETCDRLLIHRRAFPEGYFRLPWFLVAYHAMLRILLSSPAYGQRTAWEGMDYEFFLKALFSLGIGSRLADVPKTFEEFLNLPWTRCVGHYEGVLERARGFVALVRALSEAAIDCGTKVRLEFPLFSSFVSYARADRDFAKELVTAIERRNVADVWWDQSSIAMGGNLTETLRKGIALSERFVLIASKASAANLYVQLELRAALEMEKPIIVICRDKEICSDWQPTLGELRANERLTGLVHCSGEDVELYSPPLLATLTRNQGERLAWLSSRPSSF